MRESERTRSAVPAVNTPFLDQIFDLLADRRRRYALYYLREVDDGVAAVHDVADHVSALEENRIESVEQQFSVLTSLQHVHLPKLEDAGVLEYDARSETIRYWGQPSLDEWLEHAQHKEL